MTTAQDAQNMALFPAPAVRDEHPTEHFLSSNTVVELKGGMYTLMSLRLHSSDIDQIDAGIADKVQQAPGFFSDTPIVIDLSEIETSDQLDTELLLGKIREHKLVPVMASVMDKSSPLAEAINLPLVETLQRRKRPSGKAASDDGNESAATSLVQGKKDRTLDSAKELAGQNPGKNGDDDGSKGARSPKPGTGSAALAELAQMTTQDDFIPATPMLVTRPVRSGQQLYARETDLIIMAHVGPGAEIVADNNVHVYGPLRGRALCGVTGNTESRIFCQSLEAELVSVAGNYKVLEEIPENLRGKPAQIWLEEGRLNIEAI